MSLASEGVDEDLEVSSFLDIYQFKANDCDEWTIENGMVCIAAAVVGLRPKKPTQRNHVGAVKIFSVEFYLYRHERVHWIATELHWPCP